MRHNKLKFGMVNPKVERERQVAGQDVSYCMWNM